MNYSELPIEELRRISLEVSAAVSEKLCRISRPEDLYTRLLKYQNLEQEHFFVITLSGCHSVINIHTVTIGLVNRSVVHPREIFRLAINDNAVAIIVAHNHPSGSCDPSPEDSNVTEKLVQAGEILSIPVLDHIIIGNEFFSFLDEGRMP